MKNEKKLLNMPVSAPPEIVIEDRIEKVNYGYKKGFYTKTTQNFKYSAEVLDDKVLMLTVYNKDNDALFRTFTSDYQYVSQCLDDNNKRSEMKLGYKFGDYQYYKSTFVTDNANEEIIKGWLKSYKKDNETSFHALSRYQQGIGERAIKERNDRIRKSVDDLMLQIRPLPKDFENWIDNVPLKNSRYILYQYAKKKYLDGHCTHCDTAVKVVGAKHQQKGKCPNCKSAVVFLASGKTSSFVDKADIAYIQPGKDGELIFRYFYVSRDFNKRGTRLVPSNYIHEEAREFYFTGKAFEWGDFRQTGEYRFCEKYYSHIQKRGFIYYKNLKGIFKKNERRASKHMQYIPFADFLKNSGKISVLDWYIKTISNPVFEYLIKLKLYRIVADCINGYCDEHINLNGKSFSDVLGLGKEDLPYLQKHNIGLDEIEIYQILKKNDKKAIQAAIDYHRSDIRGGLKMAKMTAHTTFHKAHKYVEAQTNLYNKSYSHNTWYNHKNDDTLRDWEDYIGSCLLLGYDIKNEFVLFPKDLKKAHDEAMELVKQDKTIYNTAIAGMESEINKQYYYSDKKFLIRAPKSADEIVKEGQKLKHCVGKNGYIEKMAKRRIAILFIREARRPTKPFYTMEVEDGEIQQVRGKCNIGVTPEVQKFIDAWQKRRFSKNIKEKVAV